MGWLIDHLPSEKKDYIARLVAEMSRGEWKTLAHACHGNELWMLTEHPKHGVIILLCLLRSERGGCWGYKDMDESMGPCYYKCPLAYLDRAPERNAEWRAKVRAYHAKRQDSRNIVRKLKPGMTVKLRGSVPNTFRVVEVGRKIVGVAVTSGQRFRLPKARIVEIVEESHDQSSG